jgi:hypothetical protein
LPAAFKATTLLDVPAAAVGFTHASSDTPLLVLRLRTFVVLMWLVLVALKFTAVSVGSESKAPGAPSVTPAP